MKKTFLLLTFIFALLQIKAQSYRSNVGLNVGINTLFATYYESSLPAVQLTYDYMLNDLISLGISLSEKTVSSRTGIYTGDYNLSSQRFTYHGVNLSLRPLFHFGTRRKADFYTGYKIGYYKAFTTSGISASNINHDYTSILFFDDENAISFQLILLGFRKFFNENWGMNFELAIGAPYVLAFGMNYRW